MSVLRWIILCASVVCTVGYPGSAGSGSLRSILSGKSHGKRTVVLVDATTADVDEIQELWTDGRIAIRGEVSFGLLQSGVETFANLTDPRALFQKIQSIAPETEDDPSDDLFDFLSRAASAFPDASDVVLFTERNSRSEPLSDDVSDELRRKHNRVFVVWTGDVLPYALALRELGEKTGGSFETLAGVLGAADNYDRVDAATEETTSGKVNESGEYGKSYKDLLSWNSKGKTEDVAVDEKGLMNTVNLERVRFPDGSALQSESHSNSQGTNSSSLGRQQTGSKASFVIPVIVEVASNSRLQANPGAHHRIQFDVKNNLYTPMPLQFTAMQPQNLRVTNVQPFRSTLAPSESIKVEVTLQSFPDTSEGAEGSFRFAAQSADGGATQRQVLVHFTNKVTTDTADPKVTYTYRGDCKHHDKPDTCEGGEWTMEAVFQDESSGLKKIMSEPYGLIFKSPFVAGTKSPVSVFYEASCCRPKIEIWAEDGSGNYIKRSLDVNNQGLLTGEVAAIVLGALLIIFIIVAIIVAVVFVRRRNQSKLVIPRYQGNN